MLFGVVIVGLQACIEEPNPVGSRILPGSDLLRIDTVTVYAVNSSTQHVVPNSNLPARLLVGKAGDYEAWAVIRFSSLPDSLVLVNVLGAEMKLRVLYHFGDSLAPFSMDVHRILKGWGTDSLTIDSLQAPGFYQSSPLTMLNTGAIDDSTVVTVPMDTSIVRSWLNTPLDTVATNFGVLLKPTNTGVIKGFATSINSTFSYRPELVVRYTRQGTTRQDTVRLRGTTEAFVAFTKNTSWLSDSSRIYVRNGLAYRGLIDFNISALPFGSSIHKAVMQVTLDPAASRFNSLTRDSLYAYFVTEEGVYSLISSLSEPALIDGRKVYQFQITTSVQIWSRSNNPRRIAIAGYTENYSLDSFVLYGASSALKPKLSITYSSVK